jgi:hypothetical protein
MTHASKMACEADAIAAGALDTERVDPAERRGPRLEAGVALAVDRHMLFAETRAEMIERHGNVDVLVRVDPDDDLPSWSLSRDAGHGCSSERSIPAGRGSGTGL